MTTVTSSSPSLYSAKAPVVTTLNSIGIEDALKAIRLRPNVKVNITDSVANIKKYLGALTGVVNNVGTISQNDASTDTLVALTASQYTSYSKVLAKLDAGSPPVSYKLSLSGVTAAAAIAYNTNSRILTLSVTDSSANIGTNIAGLKAVLLNNKLGAITQSGATTPIALTRASYEANAAVLGKIGTAYTVAMTAATATQAVGYTSNARIGSISIVDTTGGVEAKLDDLQKLGVRLKRIEVSDAGVTSDGTDATNGKIDLTAAQAKSDALVIGKIYNSYQLAVHNASLAQSASLSTNKKVVTIDIVDRGENIVKSLAMLNRLGSQVKSVTVTDSDNPLALSDAQLVSYDTLLGKFEGGYSVDIAGSSALNAKLLLQGGGGHRGAVGADYAGVAGAHIHSISISDTAANISSYFDGLNDQSKVSKVTVLGPKTAIVLTANQLAAAEIEGVDSILSKITSGYSLKITDVAAVDAADFSGSLGFNAHITAITVTDDADSISDNLLALTALGGKLESLVQTDRLATSTTPAVDFELGYAAWTTHKATLEKVVGNYSAILSGVSAGVAATVAADSHISAFSVTDSGAEMAKNFDALINVGSRLDEVTQSDTASLKLSNSNGSSLTITAAQYSAGTALLDKFAGTAYALAVTGMTVGQVLAIGSGDQVVSTTVLDTSANIASNLDALSLKVTSGLVGAITQQGTASTLAITAAQLAADANVLANLTGNYSLTVSGVAVADATSLLAANSHVASVSVAGTNAVIKDNLSVLKDLGKKLIGISIASGGSVFTLGQADYASYRTTLDKIGGNYTVNLTGVSVGQVATLAADTHVGTMAIADTAASVSGKFDTLRNYVAKIESINGGISATAATALTLTASQYALGSALLAKINYTGATVKGVTAAVAQSLKTSDDKVTSVTVTDTSAKIAENLDALQANGKVTSITQSATVLPLAVTRAQLTADAATLAKITGNYSLTVSGVSAAEAKDLLAGNSKIASISVTATAAEIATNLGDLGKLGSKLVALVQSDPANAISLTDASLATNRAVIDKIDGYRVNVSGVSAARALVLADNDWVVALDITASGAEVSTYFDALKTVLPKISGINNPSSGTAPVTALALSATQYAQGGSLLAKIGDYSASLKGVSAGYAATLFGQTQVNSVTVPRDTHVIAVAVVDTSASIVENLSNLEANTTLNGIILENVTEPLNITYSQRTAAATVLGTAVSPQQAQGLIAGSWKMNVSGVPVGGVLADDTAILANFNGATHVASFSVTSNAAAVVDSLSVLAGSTKLSSITLDVAGSTLSISAAALLSNLSTVQKIDNGYSLSVSATTVANLADLAAIDNVSAIQISDSSLHLSAQFDDLVALGATLTALTVSNAAIPLALTYEQWVAGADTLGKIAGAAYQVDLFEVPAANVGTLSSSSIVDEIYVTDYSYNIASQWEALTNKAKLTTITLLDNDDIRLTQEQQAVAGSAALIDKIQGTFFFLT